MVLNALLEIFDPGSLENGRVSMVVGRIDDMLVHGSLQWRVFRQCDKQSM
jgi:hypothetical protein